MAVPYEEVYLRASPSVSGARAGIGQYPTFYNRRRPHPSLDGRPPARLASTRRCPVRERHNQGGNPLGKRPEPVQRDRTGSLMTASYQSGLAWGIPDGICATRPCAGRSVESLARAFEPCAASIAGWIEQAGIDGRVRDDGQTSLQREELARLRKENRQLRMERDILSKGRSLEAPLVIDAMNMAVGQRRAQDVIHHSDQGSQYTSVAFGLRGKKAGVRRSMGSVGDAYDNAMPRLRRAWPSSSSSKAGTIRAVARRLSAASHPRDLETARKPS